MRNISKLDAGFGNITGAILAIASGGSLVGMIILLVTMLAATPTFAQDEPTDIQVELKEVESELAEELSEAAMEIQEALDEVGIETGIHINIDDDGDDRPKLGVYLSDMDFEDAYKMRYPYPHGTLVDGTVRSGNADKAGLIEDDIIMYFDGTKVLYEDHLVRLIRSKHYGDQVEIVYWRDEAMDTTQVTFAMPEKPAKPEKLEIVKKEEKKKIEFLLTKLNTTMSLPIEGTNLSYTRDILEKMDKCKISEHFSDLPQADLLLCNYELKQYGELGNEVDLNECKDKLEKIKAEKESKEKEDYIRTTDGIEILKNIEEKNERASKNLTEWNG